MTLQRFTWDQAEMLGLATAKGFKPLGITAVSVRRWASDGLIAAVGKAPGGAHLYSIAEVSAVADRPRRKPGPKKENAS